MEKFAGYGFNRSHSAAYGLLTYQTAYLKCHFPVEFFAGLLTCEKDKTEEVVKCIAEARSQGIRVLRPDVNESDADFTVVLDEAAGRGAQARAAQEARRGKVAEATPRRPRPPQKAIRFGLAAVKGVGEGAVEVIRAARVAGGRFLSLVDFCQRVDTRKVNRKVLEALVKAGAFDGIAEVKKVSRAKMFQAIGPAIDTAAATQRERDSGQTSLLSLFGGGSAGSRRRPPRTFISKARNGRPSSCWPSRRRAWASTSAGIRWIASPASCAASPTPSPATAPSAAGAPRSFWAAWFRTTKNARSRAARANTPSSSWRTSTARSSSTLPRPSWRNTETC
jgi:DNA polymerase III alpha subunit